MSRSSFLVLLMATALAFAAAVSVHDALVAAASKIHLQPWTQRA